MDIKYSERENVMTLKIKCAMNVKIRAKILIKFVMIFEQFLLTIRLKHNKHINKQDMSVRCKYFNYNTYTIEFTTAVFMYKT